jgi:hypothetical protein
MILINSYPRSGNNYAQLACRTFLDEDFDINHEPRILNNKSDQIVILRNPYEAIASNVERFALDDKSMNLDYTIGIPVEQNADYYINKYIAMNIQVYELFLDYLEDVDDSTLVVNFNQMVEDPEDFVRNVSKFFGCSILHEDKLAGIKEILHTRMSTEFQYFYPKSTTHRYRQLTNKLIYQYPVMENLHERYIDILVNQNII